MFSNIKFLFCILYFLFVGNTFSTYAYGKTKKDKTIVVDSINKTITKTYIKSRGTGGGYSGTMASWTKTKERIYDFDNKLTEKSLTIRRNFGCMGIVNKARHIKYKNGRWISKTIKRRFYKKNKTITRK